MADLIVITGGSYSGKTSVIETLAARGHEVVPEAAYEVIREMNDVHGVEGQIRWREDHLYEFQRLVGVRQHARETAARASSVPTVFCDRGLFDGLAYCQHNGIDWPAELYALAEDARYAHVFLLETLATFDPRTETGRSARREDSLRIATLIEDIYEARAFDLTRVPQASVVDRVELVLKTVGVT